MSNGGCGDAGDAANTATTQKLLNSTDTMAGTRA